MRCPRIRRAHFLKVLVLAPGFSMPFGWLHPEVAECRPVLKQWTTPTHSSGPARRVTKTEITREEYRWDQTGDAEGFPAMDATQLDTVWIGDWTFDSGGACTASGWTHRDGRIRNDGSNFWSVNTAFNGMGGVANNAGVLGDPLFATGHCGTSTPDGKPTITSTTTAAAYGNDWDYSIVVKYRGAIPTLSFNFLSDSEPGFDFISVECDSLGLSESRVNYATNPSATPSQFRTEIFRTSGLNLAGKVSNLPLVNYTPGNAGAVHEAYIRFHSDEGGSECDSTTLGAALVVDSLRVTGGIAYLEDFEGALDPNVQLLNTAPDSSFGDWARLFKHCTDNDVCTENTTCAWLFTDPTLQASSPGLAYGPGGYVIRNWLDNVLLSPMLGLAPTPGAQGTFLSFRYFPGNRFGQSKIVMGVRVEVRGDSVECNCRPLGEPVSILNPHQWTDATIDISPSVPPQADSVRIAFRITDYQYIMGEPPPPELPLLTGPGPYLDRVRLGRRLVQGPVFSEKIDARSQAQDAFAAVDNAITPGEHHSPSTSRFGAVPFDRGGDLGINGTSPNLITGDSIHVQVTASSPYTVKLYGAIRRGPHRGKRPPGTVAGPDSFFVVSASPAMAPTGTVVANQWFVDLPDHYLYGGDELVYFWWAADIAGGAASNPSGIPSDGAGNPAITSVSQAEDLTNGLLGMSALPAITWDASYLAAVAADPEGDVDPTPTQVANSSQANCILYYNEFAKRRRSGRANRTSFMYTLDRLGYSGHYDVYDVSGYGNTNNQLGSRASVQQAQGYNLIVCDVGNMYPDSPILPNGVDTDAEKIDQAIWFRNWLAQASLSEAGYATLWILGSNVVEEKPTNALINTSMGVALTTSDQALNINPLVDGQASFTFDRGASSAAVDFNPDLWALNGGCTIRRDYDGIAASGTALRTHRYKSPGTGALGEGAIVMNRSNAENWNTILQTHPWFDIRDPAGTPASTPPETAFLAKILQATLPAACLRAPLPSGTGDGDEIDVPRQTVLHQNIPNPFNPSTAIEFDLAQAGHVTLGIFDVAGRRVQTLIDAQMKAGRSYRVVWNGHDAAGRLVPSGMYLYRLMAPDRTEVRKMVVLR